MKKTTCHFIALFLLSFIYSLSMNADTKFSRKVGNADQAPVVSKRGQADGERLWWGYFTDNDANSLQYDGYLGYNEATTIDAAICIPKEHPIAGGGTIKAMRFWLGDDISAINSDVTLWISSSLPNKISEADYIQTVPRSSLTSRLNEIELKTPYIINNGLCYVGFSFSISGESYPILGGGEDANNSWFFRITGYDWDDLSGEGYGKLALQILLDGVTLHDYSVTPSDFGTNCVQTGTKVNVPVKIFNYGKETINSIAYTISTNGEVSAEQTLLINGLPFNNSTTISVPFPADNDTKRYNKTLTITKVNGVNNEANQKSSVGSLITITEKLTPIPVVEEFTGTWCGWCTIGYDGMEKAKEYYGDKIVLIAVHDSDPMETIDYFPIASRAIGYPSSIINRSVDVYPSAAYLRDEIDKCMDLLTIGKISATASWADEGKTSIKIDTETTFAYDEANGQYGIAFVLIEDGMTGTGSEWAQSNYLSGNSSYAESYPFWYNAESRVTGLEFNHVGVAAWDIEKGVDGSIKSAFTSGEVLKYSKTVDIRSKNIIQDKSKLKVAVLLIDRSTGNIVNAAQTTIKDNSTPNIFKFQYMSKDLEDDATIIINAEEDSWGFGEMNCETNPSTDPKNGLILASKDGKKLSGTATINILSNTLNPQIVQWCMGGECVPMNGKSTLTKDFTTDNEGICLVMFDATNIKSEGALEARLTATVDSETRTVYIKFIYDNTNGINIIYTDEKNAEWYDMNGTRLENAPTRKGVYIKNGKKVIR